MVDRRLVALACALLVLICAPAAAAFEPDLQPAFTYGGTDCVEPGVIVGVPVARARAAVPEPFVPLSLSGDRATADVVLVVARCGALDVDGRTVAGTTVVDAGVVIASPDQSEGVHAYQLWQLSDSPAVSERMASVGVRGDRVSGLAVADVGAAPVDRASARVPWSFSPYDFSVDAAVPATASERTTWWHRGARGIVRLGYRFPRSSVRTGSGRLNAQAGSPLAELVGGTSVDAAGSVARLDFAGSVAAERRAGESAAPPSPSSSPAPPSGSAPAAPVALRVVVRPSRVRAGRRVRLVARVTSAGRPVRRALVRIAGRRARTDARGRATLRVSLRPGRHRLVATRPGSRPARATVVARG